MQIVVLNYHRRPHGLATRHHVRKAFANSHSSEQGVLLLVILLAELEIQEKLNDSDARRNA